MPVQIRLFLMYHFWEVAAVRINPLIGISSLCCTRRGDLFDTAGLGASTVFELCFLTPLLCDEEWYEVSICLWTCFLPDLMHICCYIRSWSYGWIWVNMWSCISLLAYMSTTGITGLLMDDSVKKVFPNFIFHSCSEGCYVCNRSSICRWTK